MKKQYVLTILCCTLLILPPIQNVIGEQPHQKLTKISSPLFKIRNTITPHNHKTHNFSRQYLGDHQKNLKNYTFSQQSPTIPQLLQIIIKYIPKQELKNTILQQLNNDLPNSKPFETIENPQIINRVPTAKNTKIQTSFNKGDDKNHLNQENILLIEPYSTIFPTCVLLVIITIIFLYTYILLVDISDLILLIIENLFLS